MSVPAGALCVATRFERLAAERGLARSTRGGLARRLRVIESGIGVAREPTTRELARCSVIVSLGLAGALDPELASGAWLVPRQVLLDNGTAISPDPAWRNLVCDALTAFGYVSDADLAHATGLVASSAEKDRLRERSGAAAVDMESALLGRIAERHGIPFVVLRVIADAAATPIPGPIDAAITADGGMSVPRLAAACAASPAALPAMLRFLRDVATGRGALIEAVRIAAAPLAEAVGPYPGRAIDIPAS